jgi:hypothetical protein
VTALLEMMDKALAGFSTPAGDPSTPTPPESGGEGPAPEAPVAPPADDERAAWIRKLLDIVQRGGMAQREEAVRGLVGNDKDGDCIDPLLALLTTMLQEKQVAEVTTIVRGLGVPGLEKAALVLHDFLRHKDDALRANTVVTLEYIGSAESVKPLTARSAREDVEPIANDIYRALGRCGVGDSGVRQLLLKKVKASKSEAAAFGPIVGLAYFEKDAKAARGIEKELKSMGPPGGGRRGGWTGTMKRAMLAWCVGEIADPKGADFMRERMLKPMENTQAWWKGAVMTYYDAIARKCEGDEKAKDDIDAGIQRTLEFSGGTSQFQTAARQGRDKSKFEPKAEWEVQGRDLGGGAGGGDPDKKGR